MTQKFTDRELGMERRILRRDFLHSVTSANAALTVTATSPSDVATFKSDAARSGQNLAESTLTLANVNSTSFGLLHTGMVDGKVDAQPLYLSQVPQHLRR